MDDVLVIEGRIGAVKPVRTAIVRGRDTWLWIDAGIAGTPTDFILPELRRLGLTPPARNLLLITHCDVDHFGGATELAAAVPGLVIVAHRADADLMADLGRLVTTRYDRFRDAGLVLPGERAAQLRARAGAAVEAHVLIDAPITIDVGAATTWEVVEVPGHSAGHVAAVASDRSIVFAGDAVMGWGVRDGDGNLQPPHYVDAGAYLSSIAALERISPRTLHLAHEAPFSGDDLTAFLRDSREAVVEIGAAVARAGDRIEPTDPDHLRLVCEAVHAELDRWPDAPPAALADPVAAHLAAAPRERVAA
jgi:glyoxylase-like metal-dependent hydrolase (beta-lactamase superfamily II)